MHASKSLVAIVSLVAGGVIAAALSTRSERAASATADDDVGAGETVTEVPDPPPADVEPAPPPDNPFQLYAADEGAPTWDDLSDDEKAAAEGAQEWAETQNGAEVHNAFSAAVATTSDLRRVEIAARTAGLEGVDTLGVVP